MPRTYLSRGKAADYLDVSPATIDRWSNPKSEDCRLTRHKIGSRVVYDEAELDIVAGRDVDLSDDRADVIRAAKAAGISVDAISLALGLSHAVIDGVV